MRISQYMPLQLYKASSYTRHPLFLFRVPRFTIRFFWLQTQTGPCRITRSCIHVHENYSLLSVRLIRCHRLVQPAFVPVWSVFTSGQTFDCHRQLPAASYDLSSINFSSISGFYLSDVSYPDPDWSCACTISITYQMLFDHHTRTESGCFSWFFILPVTYFIRPSAWFCLFLHLV